MKLRDLWSPMSDLNQSQKDVSNSVVGGSLAFLGVVAIAAMPLAASAQERMGGYSLPGRPAPAPTVAPYTPPAPAPTYQPPAPSPQPAPVQYGQFRAYGPLPSGRVNVQMDGSFDQKEIWGFTAFVQDNGEQGNDQMIVYGPEGTEQIWLNCWVTEEWKSFGPNSEQFIHSIVSQWCGWES